MILKHQVDSIYNSYKAHITDVSWLTLLEMSYILPPQHAKRNTFLYDFESAGQLANQCRQLHCSTKASLYCF